MLNLAGFWSVKAHKFAILYGQSQEQILTKL
jgi:hypothetical protein